ncbi:MAG: phosphatase PAP2 family protein [Anaerolineales bacterium]|nr:phosphatase PAP2 family protein [Anaerolineales bacterium]
MTIDNAFTNKLRIAEKPGPLRTFAVVLAHSGDSWFWILGLIFMWWFGTPYWKSRALVLGISVIFTAILVMLIKFTVKRRRPEGEWGAIYRATDPHSFPSGHATRAFMLAVIALGFGPLWFAIVLLIWAPLVALARVAMGVHYLSDVIAGFLLGIVMGGVMIAILKPLFLLS